MPLTIKRQVLLDTNMFFLPFRFKVDIISEIDRLMDGPHELCVASRAIGEMEHLLKKKGTRLVAKAAYSLLISLISQGKVRALPSSGRVDEWLTAHARREGAVVCTNDMLLRRALKKAKLRVISLRSNDHLEFI